MDRRDKRDAARKLEVVTSVGAGSVGATLGAAKLRDAYAEEHPAKYVRAERTVARATSPKVARFLAHAKPGFKPLAAATATAITATAASKYRQHQDHQLARQRAIAKADKTLQRLDTADDKARALRLKIVPTKGKIIDSVQAGTAKVKAEVQRDMSKAYSPERSRRRRKRAVAIAAGGGAVGAGVAAAKEARDAHGRWADSGRSQVAASSQFGAARDEGILTAQRLARQTKKIGEDKAISRNTMQVRQTAIHQGRSFGHMDHGIASLQRAYDEAIASQKLARGAKRKAALGAGLAAVAIGAHRKAKRQH